MSTCSAQLPVASVLESSVLLAEAESCVTMCAFGTDCPESIRKVPGETCVALARMLGGRKILETVVTALWRISNVAELVNDCIPLLSVARKLNVVSPGVTSIELKRKSAFESARTVLNLIPSMRMKSGALTRDTMRS